jgi:acyl-CoA thioester hydrolase
MDRIKINFPAPFSFSTSIFVRITDLNYGNHVGNDRILTLAHEARIQFLNKLGYTELSLEGTQLIMADTAIEFKKEILYGSELMIHVAAANFSRLGFDLYYLFEIITAQGPVVAAKVKTGMMCYNYTEKKKTSLPEKAIERMQQSTI